MGKQLMYGIIIILAFVILIGPKLASIFPTQTTISCDTSSANQDGIFDCSLQNAGYIQSTGWFSEPGKTSTWSIDTNIREKGWEGFKFALMRDSPIAQEFYTTQTPVCSAGGRIFVHSTDDFAGLSKYRDFFGEVTSYYYNGGDSCINHAYNINTGVYTQKLFGSNQLIIIKGTINEVETGLSESFVTSGMCDLYNQNCIVKEPTLTLISSNPYNYHRKVSITDIKIYLKMNGYQETDNICVQDGLTKCDGKILYTCSNLAWVNNGQVIGQCGNVNPIQTQPTQTNCQDTNSCSVSQTTTTNLWQQIINFFNSIFKFLGLSK